MIYRVNKNTEILWKAHDEISISCILEMKIQSNLEKAHDESKHWEKKNILTKLREIVYWSNQFENVTKYIRECLKCARYKSIIRFQLLHLISVTHSFQLLKINYINFMKITNNENTHIFYVIDYMFRFFFTFACLSVKSNDTLKSLKILFSMYELFMIFYIDFETHFDAKKIRNFFKTQEIIIYYIFSDSFKNTSMIEIKNRLMKMMLRKQDVNWDLAFASFILQLNSKNIHHLKMSSSFIFLEIITTQSNLLNIILTHASVNSMKTWFDQVSNDHKEVVSQYLQFLAQLHDHVKSLSNEKKIRNVKRYNQKIIREDHAVKNLKFFYQKDQRMLKSRWRKSFILNSSENHDVSWKIRQLNERTIKRTYHDDHLKIFVSRKDYLANDDVKFDEQINLRRSRKAKKMILKW